MHTAVIEQTREYPMRMRYDPAARTFLATEYEYLGRARNSGNPYGWLKSSGTPPGPHLDVIVVSKADFALGDEVPVRIVGCFLRSDNDHKLVAVPCDRHEEEFEQLTSDEKEELRRLYPRVDEGEGWFGAERAREIMEDFAKVGRRTVHKG